MLPKISAAKIIIGKYDKTAPPNKIHAPNICPILCNVAQTIESPQKLKQLPKTYFPTMRPKNTSTAPQNEKNTDVGFPKSNNNKKTRESDSITASAVEKEKNTIVITIFDNPSLNPGNGNR